MRILVISDTHIPVAAQAMPSIIKEEAKKADCCIHAGDFITYEVFEELSLCTEVYGVCGNMDNRDVRKKLPNKRIIKLENITAGLIHGKGSPLALSGLLHKEFLHHLDEIDIFIFGHSHCPLNKEIENKIYFNPGSPTDRVFTPYCSYGILEISNQTIKRRIVKIE